MSVRVLVIDDDGDTRENLRDILEMDDYSVDLAGTAREALARDNWDDVAVIILDRRLPDESADTLLPKLRRLAPEAIVIICTGYADMQSAVAALRLGAADYIFKPIDAAELRNRLGRITEHRKAEQEVEKQTRVLHSVMETIPDAVMVIDEQGKIVLFNPAVHRLIGPAAVGNGPERWPQRSRSFRADQTTPFADDELALYRALHGTDVINEEQYIARPGQAASIWVSANASTLRDDRGAVRGAVIVWRDISERKRAEEQLLQSERLAAIGQMMTGLAHESGNALARSQSCLEMLTWEVEDRPAALDLISRVQKAQDDLRLLYEEVRGYAAPLKLDRDDWSLAGIWRQAWENLTVQRQGRQAKLREAIDGIDLKACVDSFRLEQVFRNILENALAACADPVLIDVRAAAARLEGRAALRLSFHDNGPGLGAEQRKRIFEPFFTTKTKGTGLGMAIAKRIIEAHGGSIAVGSGSGPGAEIVITLPREHS